MTKKILPNFKKWQRVRVIQSELFDNSLFGKEGEILVLDINKAIVGIDGSTENIIVPLESLEIIE